MSEIPLTICNDGTKNHKKIKAKRINVFAKKNLPKVTNKPPILTSPPHPHVSRSITGTLPGMACQAKILAMAIMAARPFFFSTILYLLA